MVARGFLQVEGLDYHEIFSHVTKMSFLRVMFALAIELDFEIHQMDVKIVFFKWFSSKQKIFMDQP